MNINFQIKALQKTNFSCFFSMTEAELAASGAYLFNSDQCPCYPCRVSLTDAAVGEKVLALSFEHLPVNSPYRASGPIFVRELSTTASPEINEIPEMLRHRTLSLRGYSDKNLMIEADTVDGKKLEAAIVQQFSNTAVSYLHVHNAGPGCFNCKVERG
jgi:hypothetical protein